MNRRGFIAAASGSLIGARRFAEKMAVTPGRPAMYYEPSNTSAYEAPPAQQSVTLNMDDPKVWAEALLDPLLRGEIESLLYEERRNIRLRDVPPDLAVLKSFSNMAKLTFHRQDLVRQALEMKQQQSPGWRVVERMYKWAGLPARQWYR